MFAHKTLTLVRQAMHATVMMRHKAALCNGQHLPKMAENICRFYSSEKSAEKEEQPQPQPQSQPQSQPQPQPQSQPQPQPPVEAEPVAPVMAETPVEAIQKLEQDVEALTAELKTMQQKNETLTDKYKRSLAEGENMRVRLNKQIGEAKIFSIQGFCKDLLEVADTLGLATSSVPLEALEGENPQLKNLYAGLLMTQASLLQVFRWHGLEPVNPINQKFDPTMHEALFQKEDPNIEPNIVVEVTKLGFKLHERCVRPALVGVSK